MRRRGTPTLMLAAASVVALTACATTPPETTLPPSPSATPTATPVVSTPTPTPTRSGTPSPSPTPSSTKTPKPATSAPAELLLTGDGIGGQQFGAREPQVEAMLTGLLGSPDDVSVGVECDLDDQSPWSRALSYGGLSVLFVADVKSKTAPRYLRSWSISLESDFPDGVRLQDDLPTNLSFAELQAKYPKGTLDDSGFGDDTKIFTHPDGIRYIGTEYPDLLQAGELAACD